MEEYLVFRGDALEQDSGAALLVRPSGHGAAEGGAALELDGEHAALAAAALAMACAPITADTLASSVARRTGVSVRLAQELVGRLAEERILRRAVPASGRVRPTGDAASAAHVRGALEQATWPADLAGVVIACLGALGSPAWRDHLAEAERRDAGATLSMSLEREVVWIGPAIRREGAPCPACLLAARLAARPEALVFDRVVARSSPALATAGAHALLRAERWAARSFREDEVLCVAGDQASVHVLLRQPGCPHCVRPRGGAARAQRSSRGLAARFASDWARADPEEPTESQRAPFLDPELGPIELDEHRAEGLYRDLPLTLGSTRWARRQGSTLERRQLSSVAFGAGTSATRRRLVAFAEGVERYALAVDEPDVREKRRSELGAEALSPDDTVRFAPAQYAAGGAPGPVRYQDEPLSWSWAYEWTTETARLLPHDVFAYDPDRRRSEFRWLEDPFSSGAAAHRSLPRAVRRALLELVERDALLLAWYLRLPLGAFDLSGTTNEEVREVVAYLSGRGVALSVYDLRVDFDLPTVLVVARMRLDAGQWRAGGVVVAASTAETWSEAALHALHEILGQYTAYALVSPDGDSSIDPVSGELRPFWPAFAAYFAPRRDDPFAFLGGGGRAPLPEDGPSIPLDAALARLKTELRARELPAYVHYLAPEIIGPSGLVAVRACVPGLLRMTASRETVNFGEPRVDRIRARWKAEAGLNPLPHPIC